MSALLVGYARVSTHDQDLTAQRDALAALGVSVERTYVDHGLTGADRDRPGLCEALAACGSGDALVVTKLDRLAQSLPEGSSQIRRKWPLAAFEHRNRCLAATKSPPSHRDRRALGASGTSCRRTLAPQASARGLS